jgi:hypothetical protein
MAKTIKTNIKIEQITKTLRPFGPGKSGLMRGAMNEALSANAMNSAATTMSATSWPVDSSAASSTPRVYVLAASSFSSLRRRSRISHQMSAATRMSGRAAMRM